jgi:predicted HicB family RNase H-like nuclease
MYKKEVAKMELLEAKRKLEQRYNKQNEYNRKNYDRVSVMFPSGYREQVRDAAQAAGKSLNAYILEAVQEKMEKY